MDPKWKYFRDDISTLEHLDTKLNHWGGLGWELVTILHAIEPDGDNILAARIWMQIFKQVSSLKSGWGSFSGAAVTDAGRDSRAGQLLRRQAVP